MMTFAQDSGIFFGPKLCKFYTWCNNSFFLFIYIDTKLLEKSDLHSVLAQKLQAEKHDIPNRHEIRYSETYVVYFI